MAGDAPRYYRGVLVALKHIRKEHIQLSRNVLLEFNEVCLSLLPGYSTPSPVSSQMGDRSRVYSARTPGPTQPGHPSVRLWHNEYILPMVTATASKETVSSA